MKRYKRKFEESKLSEAIQDEMIKLFQKNIDGYGGPGIENLEDYLKTIDNILSFIANDLKETMNDEDRTDKEKTKIKNMYLNETLKYFI